MGHFGSLPGWELKIALGSLLGTILVTSWLGTENCFGTLPGNHFGSIPGWEPEIALGSFLGTILAYFLAGS